MLGTVVGLVAFAGRQVAIGSPFDFTGHWTGTSEQQGQPANTLMADFTSTGPKTFTGTVTADQPCTAKGKAKPHMKVVMRLSCGASIVKIRGQIDPASQTIQGTFAEFRKRKLRHRGTFVLSRQGGGSSTA